MKQKSFSQWLDSKRIGEIPSELQSHKITGEEVGQVARSPYLLYGLPAVAGAAFLFGAPAVLASIPVITGIAILDASRGERNGWLLAQPDRPDDELSDDLFEEDGRWWGQDVQDTLDVYGIKCAVTKQDTSGATVDIYELQPERGFNVNSINGLGDNFSRDLGLPKGKRVTADANIGGGKAALYVPKSKRRSISAKSMLSMATHQGLKIPALVGEDVTGKPFFIDMESAPHIFVGGETKSGKSVQIINMILSMAYSLPPAELEITMIDPKRVELSMCNGLPHTSRAVTDMEEAMVVLQSILAEMNARYAIFEKTGVRNIEGYNRKNKNKMSYKVVVTEELTMAVKNETPVFDDDGNKISTVGKEIERVFVDATVAARAAGIHFIFGVQRFDSKTYDGQLRQNVPSVIGMKVRYWQASEMMIGQKGCESLRGAGDCYVLMTGDDTPTRAQAAYASDEDIENIVQAIIEKWK